MLNSETEMLGRMYELGSHIVSALPKEFEAPKQKWIYVGYRDNIESISHTG